MGRDCIPSVEAFIITGVIRVDWFCDGNNGLNVDITSILGW